MFHLAGPDGDRQHVHPQLDLRKRWARHRSSADGSGHPNDAGDGDTGPNTLLNFPVITAASTVSASGARVRVCGRAVRGGRCGRGVRLGEDVCRLGDSQRRGRVVARDRGVVDRGPGRDGHGDRRGGQHVGVRQNVAVTDSLLASDAFGRAVASGWGTADSGGAYVYKPGEQPSLSVAGGVGTMLVPAPGTSRRTWLSSVSVRDVDAVVSVAADKVATGPFGFTQSLQLRRVTTNVSYNARLRVAADGSVHIAATKLTGTASRDADRHGSRRGGIDRDTGRCVADARERQRCVPDDDPSPRVERSDPEPGSWQLARTDSEASLQGPGSVGVSGYVSGGTTNAPVTFTFDNLEVRPA